jgi:hypothetical protein
MFNLFLWLQNRCCTKWVIDLKIRKNELFNNLLLKGDIWRSLINLAEITDMQAGMKDRKKSLINKGLKILWMSVCTYLFYAYSQ